MSPKSSALTQIVADALPDDVSRILVAVSGGVDSVVLLYTLRQVAAGVGIDLQVAHLDHQMRPESGSDADFVAKLCADLSLPCHLQSRDVPALAQQQKQSLEMAGRQARKEFLSEIAAKIAADLIALAHHRDDQAETFIMRLVRGSGPSGLVCMRSRQGLWWRPLLESRREQILDYARQNRLRWVEDGSNLDTAFLRNRIRAQVMPQLREMNPQYGARIAETVHQLQTEEAYWQELVVARFPDFQLSSTDGLRLSRPALLELHPAFRFRAYREALRQVRGDLQKITALHLQAIEKILSGPRSQVEVDLPDAWVARRYESLWFRTAAPLPVLPVDLELSVPGESILPNGRVLRASLQDEQEGESKNVAEFAFNQLNQPLRIRNWQAGDRFAPQGLSGHKKLKRLFSDNHVELEERTRTFILVAGETILWIVGMRRSSHAPVCSETGKILRLELI
ncbi:MAG: tRNA lysidine(34) synthetase TilS [Deltaproteobacteria bacterium]|jgi:tRNA(Ile)-lysidine synthase|nr:tRNA lysidine(34) synthetase TilS [Deltaproteobacteria bacterium]